MKIFASMILVFILTAVDVFAGQYWSGYNTDNQASAKINVRFGDKLCDNSYVFVQEIGIDMQREGKMITCEPQSDRILIQVEFQDGSVSTYSVRED